MPEMLRPPEDSGMSAPTEDPRLKLLHEVIGSRTFQKSARLSKFLEFICMRLMEGRGREINEQQIGVHVFGRSETYSAADDSIVRTQARLLRQRLEEYFEHENPDSTLIITIPKGGYVPLFEPRRHASVPVVSASQPQELQKDPTEGPIAPGTSKRSSIYILGSLLLLVLVAGTLWWSHKRTSVSVSSALWSRIFVPDQPVLIVPSDDALVLFQEATGTSVTLNDYLDGSYSNRENLPVLGRTVMNTEWFAAHQYTSSADLDLALRIARLPEAAASSIVTKNAHVLRIPDLKSANVILIGGSGSNPWVTLFSNRLNFDIGWDWKLGEGYVVNKHPAKGELAIYRDTLSQGTRKSYGVLAFVPGIDENGAALLFEGTGMAGTEAASDLPFSSTLFANVARAIGATPQHIPWFEVLLETTSVAGNAPEARIISFRLIQP